MNNSFKRYTALFLAIILFIPSVVPAQASSFRYIGGTPKSEVKMDIYKGEDKIKEGMEIDIKDNLKVEYCFEATYEQINKNSMELELPKNLLLVSTDDIEILAEDDSTGEIIEAGTLKFSNNELNIKFNEFTLITYKENNEESENNDTEEEQEITNEDREKISSNKEDTKTDIRDKILKFRFLVECSIDTENLEFDTKTGITSLELSNSVETININVFSEDHKDNNISYLNGYTGNDFEGAVEIDSVKLIKDDNIVSFGQTLKSTDSLELCVDFSFDVDKNGKYPLADKEYKVSLPSNIRWTSINQDIDLISDVSLEKNSPKFATLMYKDENVFVKFQQDYINAYGKIGFTDEKSRILIPCEFDLSDNTEEKVKIIYSDHFELEVKIVTNSDPNIVLDKKPLGYNYTENTITWEVTINQNKMTMNNLVLEDVVTDNGHKFVSGSAEIIGDMTDVSLNKQEVSSDGKILTLDFGNITSGTPEIVVHYKTKIDTYKNESFKTKDKFELKNSSTLKCDVYDDITIDSFIEINNHIINKKGTMNHDSTQINYAVDINPYRTNIAGGVLKDQFSELLMLDADSIKLYKAVVDEDGNLSINEDYTNKAKIDHQTGSKEFKVTLPSNSSDSSNSYILEYTCYVITNEINKEISNKIKFEGGSIGSGVFSASETISVVGDGGSFIPRDKLNLEINNIDSLGNELSDMKFEIYETDELGNLGKLVKVGKTNKDGKVKFELLNTSNKLYKIVEKYSSQFEEEAFIIDEFIEASKAGTRSDFNIPLDEYILECDKANTIKLTIENKRSSDLCVFFNKRDSIPIIDLNVLLKDSDGNEIINNKTDENGGISFKGIPEGNYTIWYSIDNTKIDKNIAEAIVIFDETEGKFKYTLKFSDDVYTSDTCFIDSPIIFDDDPNKYIAKIERYTMKDSQKELLPNISYTVEIFIDGEFQELITEKTNNNGIVEIPLSKGYIYRISDEYQTGYLPYNKGNSEKWESYEILDLTGENTIYPQKIDWEMDVTEPFDIKLRRTDITIGDPISGIKYTVQVMYNGKIQEIDVDETDEDGFINFSVYKGHSYIIKDEPQDGYLPFDDKEGLLVNIDKDELLSESEIIEWEMTPLSTCLIEISRIDEVTGKALPNIGYTIKIKYTDGTYRDIKTLSTNNNGIVKFDLYRGYEYLIQDDYQDGYKSYNNGKGYKLDLRNLEEEEYLKKITWSMSPINIPTCIVKLNRFDEITREPLSAIEYTINSVKDSDQFKELKVKTDNKGIAEFTLPRGSIYEIRDEEQDGYKSSEKLVLNLTGPDIEFAQSIPWPKTPTSYNPNASYPNNSYDDFYESSKFETMFGNEYTILNDITKNSSNKTVASDTTKNSNDIDKNREKLDAVARTRSGVDENGVYVGISNLKNNINPDGVDENGIYVGSSNLKNYINPDGVDEKGVYVGSSKSIANNSKKTSNKSESNNNIKVPVGPIYDYSEDSKENSEKESSINEKILSNKVIPNGNLIDETDYDENEIESKPMTINSSGPNSISNTPGINNSNIISSGIDKTVTSNNKTSPTITISNAPSSSNKLPQTGSNKLLPCMMATSGVVLVGFGLLFSKRNGKKNEI